MNKFRVALGVLLISLFVLAACASPAPTATPASVAPTATPASVAPTAAPSGVNPDDIPRERTLIIMHSGENGRNLDWKNFNNYVPGQIGGWHAGPLQAMSEPLIRYNLLSGEHEMWLAEDLTWNADFSEYTMTIKDGVKWSDGVPFTAEDVAFTFNLVRDNQNQMVHTAEIHLLDRAEVVNPRTVKFVLKEGAPTWWLSTLTTNHGLSEQILPKHIWETVEDPLTFTFYDPDKGWPLATGPYRLVSASAEQKVFVRRDDWWAVEEGFKPLPEVEKIIHLPARDESTMTQLMIANELDVMSIVPVDTLQTVFQQNPNVYSWSRQDPPYGYLDWCPVGLFFNNAADTPVAQNSDIRWAINYALDRETLVNLAERGAGSLAYHMITPYEWFGEFEPLLQPLYERHNLGNKKRLDLVDEFMTRAGYEKASDGFWAKDGENLAMNINFPGWLIRYGVHVVTQLQDAGFNATLDQTPGAGEQFGRGELPYSFGCKGPSGVKGQDPYYMLSLYSSATFRDIGQPSVNPWATARWRNEEFDAIVDQMRLLQATDPLTKELFSQAMEIWYRELPDVYIAQLIIRYSGNETYWTGWTSKDNNLGQLHPWQQEFMNTIIQLKAVN